mmetsp:Transcript_38100/g.95097  ORF Transcript_38100/g.95097 Transcript_38100/m.95097 type:complete len:152 (-) Transcript_38100:258-713(-)
MVCFGTSTRRVPSAWIRSTCQAPASCWTARIAPFMRTALSSLFSAIVAVPSVATLRHLGRNESIQEAADGAEVMLESESDSDGGIDSDDEEDEYEHYENLVTHRLLDGLDLETLNHCLVCYGCNPERRRRNAAKEFARQVLQETDSGEDSE